MTKNNRFPRDPPAGRPDGSGKPERIYSQWAALGAIGQKPGCTPETLRTWLRQHERDTGGGGLTTSERQRPKELERENRELRRGNDILRQASAYFVAAVKVINMYRWHTRNS